ncbi:MAG: hypothetical protein FJ167_15370 [Gammaproteobacteria bacterium]|nr:hypothetical protein [Gammaproteobacteria bacterium]
MPDSVEPGERYIVLQDVGPDSKLYRHRGEFVVTLGKAGKGFFDLTQGKVDVKTEDGEVIEDVDITELA